METPSVNTPSAMGRVAKRAAILCGLTLLALFLFWLLWFIGALLGLWGHVGY